MEILIFVFIFLLGTIIGSFLNVVIYRFNTGKSIAKGRSICMNCNQNLRWYELVPLFSFLIQGGKCRHCKSKISLQYPIVEIITGFIFTLIFFKFLPILFFAPALFSIYVIYFVFIFSILVVISIYDLKHKIIPDKLVFIFIIASFINIFINPQIFGSFFALPNIFSLISGPLLALPFVLIWFLSKGRLMGLGDGKLILGIGWLLGVSQGIFSIILAFWIGAFVSIIMMIVSKKKIGMKTEIPFAPFLIVSTFVAFLFSLDLSFLIKLFSI
jgi:leader peptidase (prepilin peptidase) / N-methyltransferase